MNIQQVLENLAISGNTVSIHEKDRRGNVIAPRLQQTDCLVGSIVKRGDKFWLLLNRTERYFCVRLEPDRIARIALRKNGKQLWIAEDLNWFTARVIQSKTDRMESWLTEDFRISLVLPIDWVILAGGEEYHMDSLSRSRNLVKQLYTGKGW